ncbi:hypothetical protein SpCBS45565_g05327 [Spizellomyces sp. 'palustris']|nr:hypothetical protein SpCBS45565_g05327 [Spizellomyces sp. 'palustris']
MLFKTILTAIAVAATAVGTSASGILFQEPRAGSQFMSGGPITISWFFDPNGNTFAAQGTDPVEFHLSDLRNGANTGQLIGGPIAQTTLQALNATGNLPTVVDGTNYTLRASAGNPPTYAYSPMFTIKAAGGATTSGAPAPAPATSAAAPPASTGGSTPSTGSRAPASSTPSSSSTAGQQGQASAQKSGAHSNIPMWGVGSAVFAFAAAALL